MVLRSKISWEPPAIKVGDGSSAKPPTVYSGSSSFPPPYTNPVPKEPSQSLAPPSSGNRISPAVLFVIVILAAIFFISGLLHLLVRFLIKKPSSSSRANRQTDVSGSDALQRQLQQLFHLHDSGLDQAFIDALPVFLYREIGGLKEPFDCAVCLCEFSENDKLRLLPICSHAFHLHCIDTWLLSNSTCPLCRGTLFAPGLAIENPMFEYSDPRVEEMLSVEGDDGVSTGQKPAEVEETVADKRVFPVRLGKFRNMGDGKEEISVVGETSSSNLDARRCFSMGSYQYIVGDSLLQVVLPKVRGVGDGQHLCTNSNEHASCEDNHGKRICDSGKRESFSISKIWLWPRKGRSPSSMSSQTCVSSGTQQVPDWMVKTQNI